MRKLVIPVTLLLAGCDPAEVEEDQPKQVQQKQVEYVHQTMPVIPPPAPTLPAVQQAAPKLSLQPIFQVPQAQPQQAQPRTDPQQAQAELLAKYQAIYADYAAAVGKLEQETAHIRAKDTRHRKQFYWIPLEKFGQELQARHQITSYQLAEIVNQGQQENWPTQSTKDGAAVARMFRRIRTEQALIVRHAQAREDMAMLDALVNAMIQQATAAGTATNRAMAGAGRAALTAPGPPAPAFVCTLNHVHGGG
jgi:hypothetical protein